MDSFCLERFPVVGVGLEFHLPNLKSADQDWISCEDPVLRSIAAGKLKSVDYIQIQPPHYIFLPQLLEKLSGTPVLLHVSHLSLGSLGIPMDEEFLRLTERLLRVTGSPWMAEHISWTRFEGGDTRHFVLPFLAQEIADRIVENALELQRRTGTPLLLENAPRTFALERGDARSEGDFISEVVRRSGSGFLLDLDSAMVTAEALDYDLDTYLAGLPLDRLIEIHVSDPSECWDRLVAILDRSPVRAVTVEWDAVRRAQERSGRDVLHEIRERLRKLDAKARISRDASRGASPASLEQQFVISDQISLAVRGDACDILHRGRGRTVELSSRFLPVLAHFSVPRDLGSIFLRPTAEWNATAQELFALVDGLVHEGILAPPSAVDGKAGTGGDVGPWGNWGPALDFYLDTRTRGDSPYLSIEQAERRLWRKTEEARQPSAYKDYWVHPFLPLPDPFATPASDSAFATVLLDRRTARSFGPEPLGGDRLSTLLYYTWGATVEEPNPMGDVFLKKTSPSGGSLHATEVYPILINVAGFDSGIYHYSVRRHGLELISREDPRRWIATACGGQTWVLDAAALFLSTARVDRTGWKYEFGRAFRVVMQDVGHASQTFNLVATWLGAAPFTTGALRDEIFEERLGLRHFEEPVMLLNGVGIPAGDVLQPARPRAEQRFFRKAPIAGEARPPPSTGRP
ncbi:MAG TPA: DUF692 family protein [Allosphingosinicella sp.]|nr:DUF692 family protein [Allosphingosinicella sp.]